MATPLKIQTRVNPKLTQVAFVESKFGLIQNPQTTAFYIWGQQMQNNAFCGILN
jgi:hypothetical protein